MYVISYYNEAEAQWHATGTGGFTDIDDARARMRQLSEECNRCVSFKVLAVPQIEGPQLAA